MRENKFSVTGVSPKWVKSRRRKKKKEKRKKKRKKSMKTMASFAFTEAAWTNKYYFCQLYVVVMYTHILSCVRDTIIGIRNIIHSDQLLSNYHLYN